MNSRKSIPNFQVQEPNSFTQKGFQIIIKNLQIAFLKEPVLHFSKNLQIFLNCELIKWMEIISNNKIFQFANKIKNIEDPQTNHLWFSEHSFQKLQCYFVNQFEKVIIKSYYARDRIPKNYLADIKDFFQIQKQLFKGRNIEGELINFPFSNFIHIDYIEFMKRTKQMKEIQQKYQKEKEKTIQKLLQEQLQTDNSPKKKRKRIRKKLPKNIQNQQQNKTKQQETPQIKIELIIQTKQDNLIKQDDTTIQQDHIQFDQISQISKLQDIGFNETDITIDKYFIEHEQKQFITLIKQESISSNDKNVIKQLEKEEITIQKDTNNVSVIKPKKKSKKQKQFEQFQNHVIKIIRNGAFTQFIDSISIESNNLYSYKLATYQFIAFFISSLLPPTNISLFGSNAVGLSLASSDIDIMISNNRWTSISEVRQGLYQIGNQISKMGWVVDYKLILNAKVPVLKLFIDPKIGYFDISPLKYTTDTALMQSVLIKADIIINIEGEQNIGCQSTFLMKQWLNDYPQLQRIILFFKYLLWYYGLNQNYRGGICSYCLFLMVINCLFKKNLSNNFKAQQILTKMNDQDEGTYIIQILKFYSEQFDPKNDQIYISKGLKSDSEIKIQIKKQDSSISKRLLNLKIIDPINGQYIESSFSKFQQIQQLFSMLLVESMKADNLLKTHLVNHDQINEQFFKVQNFNSPNVITKNILPNSQQIKIKKLIKKISTKLKKNEQIKYSVKDIVGIGFKVGVQNWMKRNSQEKIWT